MTLLAETEQFLHSQIPLSRAMGIQIAAFDRESLTLTAPLSVNHNHLGTAFGGSLAAVATLAGYALLWLLLEDRTSHIVISRSELRYRRPVTGDIRAVAHAPTAEAFADFKAAYARSGKGRITINVTVEEGAEDCVIFVGDLVALREAG